MRNFISIGKTDAQKEFPEGNSFSLRGIGLADAEL